MQNNEKEKGTWRSKGTTNSPALLWQDLLCCRELSQAGETGSVCPGLPAPLPRPRTHTEPAGMDKEGLSRRKRLRRSCGCGGSGGCTRGRALNHPASPCGHGWIAAPGARVSPCAATLPCRCHCWLCWAGGTEPHHAQVQLWLPLAALG